MKKGILIIGPRGSGKSYKTREIAECYDKQRTIQIFADSIYNIKENTQLVIRDEVLTIGSIEYWKQNIDAGIFKKSNIIRPQIILLSQCITKEDLAKLSFDVNEFFEVHFLEHRLLRPTVPPSAPKESTN